MIKNIQSSISDKSEPTPDISVVIVSWNVADLLKDCIFSLEKDALESCFSLTYPSILEVMNSAFES